MNDRPLDAKVILEQHRPTTGVVAHAIDCASILESGETCDCGLDMWLALRQQTERVGRLRRWIQRRLPRLLIVAPPTDAKAVLENARPAVEAMKEGRTQDYMLSAEGVVVLWDTLRQQTERAEVLERRVAVGDRMHDFLCRLFGSPDFLRDAFSKECWTLMQDWVAPPAPAADKASEPVDTEPIFDHLGHVIGRRTTEDVTPAALAAAEEKKAADQPDAKAVLEGAVTDMGICRYCNRQYAHDTGCLVPALRQQTERAEALDRGIEAYMVATVKPSTGMDEYQIVLWNVRRDAALAAGPKETRGKAAPGHREGEEDVTAQLENIRIASRIAEREYRIERIDALVAQVEVALRQQADALSIRERQVEMFSQALDEAGSPSEMSPGVPVSPNDRVRWLREQAEALKEELADGAVARYAETQGGRAVHRLWRDAMHDQGRDTLYRDVWEKLEAKDQALDHTIALGLLRDFLGHVSARSRGKPRGKYWTGKRVSMVHGAIRDEGDWPPGLPARDGANIRGTALGEPVFVEQEWLPVKWDDREDPDFCKLALITLLTDGT
jgi:hypothetical protein